MSAVRKPPLVPVVLVGLMGSGKSTVGALLAERWGSDFVDLDTVIESRSGMSVREIFDREGEAGFRAREAEATREIRPSGPVVIAAGGGWMTREDLRDEWPGAVRVWLAVSPREAARRLAAEADSRPLLANRSAERALEDLLATRLPSYSLSEYTVDTMNRTADEVAEAVARTISRET